MLHVTFVLSPSSRLHENIRAQLLMTGEPSLVAGAAALLESALRYNDDALPRLYLTGAFFMALAYCGSNLLDIAHLFRASPTHRIDCSLPLMTLALTPDPSHIKPLAVCSSNRRCPRPLQFAPTHRASLRVAAKQA